MRLDFPRVTEGVFDKTSDEDRRYNCIAHAAGDDTRWWWPVALGGYYWPPNVPRTPTIDSFVQAYMTLGYELSNDGEYEDGYEKVAIFADDNGNALHAARQLPDGQWTSKLGQWIDISHEKVAAVTGSPVADSDYGHVALFMLRAIR